MHTAQSLIYTGAHTLVCTSSIHTTIENSAEPHSHGAFAHSNRLRLYCLRLRLCTVAGFTVSIGWHCTSIRLLKLSHKGLIEAFIMLHRRCACVRACVRVRACESVCACVRVSVCACACECVSVPRYAQPRIQSILDRVPLGVDVTTVAPPFLATRNKTRWHATEMHPPYVYAMQYTLRYV